MNQHYVPRVYLKNFSSRRRNSFFIDAYDKAKEFFFNTNIKGICAEKDLYTLSNDTIVAKDVLAIENMYANHLEPIFEDSYKILVNANVFQLTPLQHVNILIGIFQLYMRNPKWMYDSIETHSINMQKQLEFARLINKDSIIYLGKKFDLTANVEKKILDFIKHEVIRHFKEKHIIGTREICEFHADAKFEICHLTDNSSFITGDNPLVCEDIINDNPHPLLRSKEFIIPLNPKVGLRMYHDNRKQLYKVCRFRGKNGSAHSYNESVIKNCSRFILGSKETIQKHFELKRNISLATDDIHKRIRIYKQVVEQAVPKNGEKEVINLMKQLIHKYENAGKISSKEEQKMFHETKKIINKLNVEKLK